MYSSISGCVNASIEHYLHKDYLGSTIAVTDEAGTVIERMDYDPFGQRRKIDDFSWLAPGTFQPKATSRGFMGHDTIDSMNLVHMKGRVYDPTIGLFLTPDPYIQDPSSVLNLNRYSYVLNNPLRYTDPSGHFFKKVAKEVGRGLSSAGRAISNPARFIQNTWEKAGRAASDPRYHRLAASIAISVLATIYSPYGAEAAWHQTAAYYAAVGATSSYVASNGDQKAALNGAVSGAAFNLIGSYFDYLGEGKELSNSLKAAKIVAHGTVGGLSSVSQGGSFESGFLSAGLSQAAAQYGVYESLGAVETAQGWGVAYNAGVAAVIGGTVSTLSGGSFEDAALNAAMGRLFNDIGHARMMEKRQLREAGLDEEVVMSAALDAMSLAADAVGMLPGIVGVAGDSIGVMTYAAAGDWDSAISSLMAVAGNDGAKSQRYMSVSGGKITGYTRHALERVIGSRGDGGVSPTAILDAVRNPITVKNQIDRGTVRYKGKLSEVVLNNEGKVVTAIPKSRDARRIK